MRDIYEREIYIIRKAFLIREREKERKRERKITFLGVSFGPQPQLLRERERLNFVASEGG